MAEFTSEINKISVDSSLRINNVNMTTLLFSDGIVCPKSTYTITDNMLILKDQPQTTLDLFQFVDSSNYYEFFINLQSKDTKIFGVDRYGNDMATLSDLVLVFVNGYKLAPSEYEVNRDENSITIKQTFTQKTISTVIVYTSADMVYEGNPEEDFSWEADKNQFYLRDYSVERYIFFKNGELLTPDRIQKAGNYVRLNTPIKHDVDFVEYYRMSKDCCALTFAPSPGYLTYGPEDERGITIQNPYNCIVSFDDIARIVVDNIRTGFFIHEVNGDGCIMMVDDDFQSNSVKCLIVEKFNKTSLNANEYYLTVPDAPSILRYVSQFDLNGTLFKELLASFQKVLLNETYDSIKRLQNIRNINKVDSSNISALINLLGFQVNITNLDLNKKHNLIEELRTFYDIVGTRASYNFYNAFKSDGKILSIKQLFTPIKSSSKGGSNTSYDFPKEWGRVVSVRDTVGLNEKGTDWVYIWSIHFENGTLPVIVNKDTLDIVINKTLYESNIDTRFNSATFVKDKWINSIATDESNYMLWVDVNGDVCNMLPYVTAAKWGWNNGVNSVHTNKFIFENENGTLVVRDTMTNEELVSWRYYRDGSEGGSGTAQEDPSKRYVTFRTAEELGATYKQKYVTETTDFGSVGELAKGAINLPNAPRFEGTLKYENYPPVLQGVIGRYHYENSVPVYSEDEIFVPITVESSVNPSIDPVIANNYEYTFKDNSNILILDKYIGDEKDVVIPKTATVDTDRLLTISVSPANLKLKVHTSDGVEVKPKEYHKEDNTFVFSLGQANDYFYDVLDENKNVIYTQKVEEGEKTTCAVLPLVNSYVISPQVGPNEPTIDCGYITKNPIDFYDFGSVSEQLAGKWVTWFDWNTRGNWYPTNHVDLSLEIPPSIDYDTFMNVFKDTFYEMASAVLYIHQITQIYSFGDPDNNGTTEVQPMSLLTTQPYETEEHCFTNDHNYLPYKKALSNSPLKLKSYSFRNPVCEFENDEHVKVTVDLYKNYGKDEYLYSTTGEEKDIECVDTITGVLPCKRLNSTDWRVWQKSTMEQTSDVSWEKRSALPTYTVTCIPDPERISWQYAIVLNYDDREEGYVVPKNAMETVYHVATSNVIKFAQTGCNGKLEDVRPNSLIYDNGKWNFAYAEVNKRFDVFEWKLPTMSDYLPENQTEPAKTGISEYHVRTGEMTDWNFNRPNELFVKTACKVNVSDREFRLSMDIGSTEYRYQSINESFPMNKGYYDQNENQSWQYSYSHNGTTWSCDLEKYDIKNTTALEEETQENHVSVLLPSNIKYRDGNENLSFSISDVGYNFTKNEPTVELEETISVETEQLKKEYNIHRYTNNLASILNGTVFNFYSYGRIINENEIVMSNMDYIVLKYRWHEGRDLDSWTYITNMSGEASSSVNNVKLGYAQNRQVPVSGVYILKWGGDNTGTGEENILLDINVLKEHFQESTPDVLNIEMYACWFSVPTTVQPTIEITGYKGGTMRQSGYQFVNDGGVLAAQQTIQAANMSTDVRREYRSVASVKYTKKKELFSLTITPNQDEEKERYQPFLIEDSQLRYAAHLLKETQNRSTYDWANYTGTRTGYKDTIDFKYYVTEQTLLSMWRSIYALDKYYLAGGRKFTKGTYHFSREDVDCNKIMYYDGDIEYNYNDQYYLDQPCYSLLVSENSQLHYYFVDNWTQGSYTKDGSTVYYVYRKYTTSYPTADGYEALRASMNRYGAFESDLAGNNIGLIAWKSVYGGPQTVKVSNTMTDSQLLNHLKAETNTWDNYITVNDVVCPFWK